MTGAEPSQGRRGACAGPAPRWSQTGCSTTRPSSAARRNLRPEFEARGKLQENDFNGYKTLRISSVLGYAPASAPLIAAPLVLGVAERILKPHCHAYRIGSATGIEIWPGEGDQVLHTDDSIYPLRIPGVEFQIGVMIALTDFTEENGATRLVLGSHANRKTTSRSTCRTRFRP